MGRQRPGSARSDHRSARSNGSSGIVRRKTRTQKRRRGSCHRQGSVWFLFRDRIDQQMGSRNVQAYDSRKAMRAMSRLTDEQVRKLAFDYALEIVPPTDTGSETNKEWRAQVRVVIANSFV